MFGSPLAMAWGPQRFLRFYLICGVGAGLIIATLPFLSSLIGFGDGGYYTYTVGASGAIYGVVLAFSLTWPDRMIALIFPPVAFRAIWLIPIFLGSSSRAAATSATSATWAACSSAGCSCGAMAEQRRSISAGRRSSTACSAGACAGACAPCSTKNTRRAPRPGPAAPLTMHRGKR